MRLNRFLLELEELGELQLVKGVDIPDSELDAAEPALRRLDEQCRLEMPDGAPEFHFEIARQSLHFMYLSCQFLLFRDLSAGMLFRRFAGFDGMRFDTPEKAWSADLVCRHLPQVSRMAQRLSINDPLNKALLRLARKLPLSSVGMAMEGVADDHFLLENSCLKKMYIDRIIAKGDSDRLLKPEVYVKLEEMLGGYGYLCRGLLEKVKIKMDMIADE